MVPAFSDDQKAAWDAVAALLKRRGVDLAAGTSEAPEPGNAKMCAVVGKAGSGKTFFLAELTKAARAAGVSLLAADNGKKPKAGQRTLAILTPTNKAAHVLRLRGVPATTLHRALYTPKYHSDYQHLVDWLTGEGEEVDSELLGPEGRQKAMAFFKAHNSVVGALAVAGLRGSDFITGWTRRQDPLDIGFVDEASMLDEEQVSDLRSLFPSLVLFGDPAQLAPVGRTGDLVLDGIPDRLTLSRVHRQTADNPILDLAHLITEPSTTFRDVEDAVGEMAARDERITMTPRVNADLMARSPVLVWRNQTRIRLIHAFRAAYDAPADQLIPGEPLVCDGVELPAKHAKRRMELEGRGLIRGAQVIYLRPGRQAGFSRLHVLGAEEPNISAASIVKIEAVGEDEPWLPFAARMGAVFVHGAALTIHKAQGSQWPDVQLFAPDLFIAARMNRDEAGVPLWKRLAYVAVTRAQERLHWITHARLARPTAPLSVDDLPAGAVMLGAPAD